MAAEDYSVALSYLPIFFGKNIPVYAGEPEGASDAYESLKTGKDRTI